MSLKRCFGLLIYCLAAITCFGQHIIPRFETYGVEEGLSQSSVYSIHQDKKGYLWFGTADGLNRFDGEQIQNFKLDPYRVKLANSNYIRGSIEEDKKGNIWYSNETGIYYYDPVTQQIHVAYVFSKKESGGYSVELCAIDESENLWLFHTLLGVYRFNIHTRTLKLFAFPPYMETKALNDGRRMTDKSGNIWMLLNLDKGLVYFNIHQQQYAQPGFAKKYVYCASSKDHYYFLYQREIDVYNKDFVFQYSIPLPASVTGIYSSFHIDFLSRIWISVLGQGLLQYNPVKHSFNIYSHDISRIKSLPINYVRTMYEDRQHNLWIGTDGGGVCRLDLKPPKFNLFPLNEGDNQLLKDYFIKCFYQEGNEIWFGTLSNGICRLNLTTGKLDTLPNNHQTPQQFVTDVTGSIIKDRKNRIWIGSSTGVAVYHPATKTYKPVQLDSRFVINKISIFIYQLKELSDGTIIAATSNGVMQIKEDEKGNFYGLYPEFFARLWMVTSIIETAPGEIWFTAPVHGLYHARLANKKLEFVNRFIPNTDLRSIHQDQENKNIIWVASGVGLIAFNTANGNYIIYTESKGLKNSYIYGVLEDRYHNLWMSTNGGLSVFNKRTKSFINYTSKDGLQSNEFNTGAFYQSPSGYMFFGGIKGFNWFHPSDFRSVEGTTYPQIDIAALKVNEQSLSSDTNYYYHSKLNLQYNQNDIELVVAALDFTKPEANKIEFFLKGWDSKPHITYNKQIRYSNLLPGDYEFKVRACNAEGIWSDEKIIYIHIQPPFWNTEWFYFLLAVLVIGLVAGFTRFVYINKLREKIKDLEKQKALEEERRRISREMHDDIGSGLTRIALISEIARHRNMEPKQLADIADTSRQLVSNMSEIIWSLNPEYKTLDQLISYLREGLYKILEPSGMQYEIDLPEINGCYNNLSNVFKRNILLVTKEIVHNAVKHSNAKHISIKATVANHHLYFEITDDGVGFDLKQQHWGNGLKNIHQRLNDLNARFSFSSVKEKGVKVQYAIPLNSHEKNAVKTENL